MRFELFSPLRTSGAFAALVVLGILLTSSLVVLLAFSNSDQGDPKSETLGATSQPTGSQMPSVQAKEIERNLSCPCGCGMTVETCQSAMTCSEADSIHADVMRQLTEGKTEKEVYATLVAKYGEKILAAPTKKGLNLAAWILPFVAILASAWAIYLGVSTWVRRKNERLEATAEEKKSVLSPEDEARLQKELDALEE